MPQTRKVPINAGAEWLLGGFGLLRRAPLALGLLAVIWGGLSVAASMSQLLPLNLLLALLGPILFGGLVYAAREVDQGRKALPVHLLQGPRDGKLGRLLAMLLPQVAALVVVVVLLYVLVGSDNLQRLMQVAVELQANPDPALIQDLPTGRLFVWLLLAILAGILAGFFTFVAVPQVMFTDSSALAAMRASFQACLRNLGALVVLFVLVFITVIALSIAANLVALLVHALAGEHAAVFVAQLLLMAVLLPVLAGAVYFAWKQLLGEGSAAVVATTGSGIEA